MFCERSNTVSNNRVIQNGYFQKVNLVWKKKKTSILKGFMYWEGYFSKSYTIVNIDFMWPHGVFETEYLCKYILNIIIANCCWVHNNDLIFDNGFKCNFMFQLLFLICFTNVWLLHTYHFSRVLVSQALLPENKVMFLHGICHSKVSSLWHSSMSVHVFRFFIL